MTLSVDARCPCQIRVKNLEPKKFGSESKKENFKTKKDKDKQQNKIWVRKLILVFQS